MRLAGLTLVILAAALVWAACGGGGGSSLPGVVVEPGRVSCDAFRLFNSYRYRAEVVLDLKARDPSMEPTDPYQADPFKLTTAIEGAIQEGDRIQATVNNVEFNQPPIPFIIIGDVAWLSLAGNWQAKPLSEINFPIPYLPRDTCDAIAPDIRVGDLSGEPEVTGDIPSKKYHFDSLRSDLPDRHPSFGPGSDAARLINEYQGDIWIADDGSYISKLDLTGTGFYENGRELNLRIFLEIFDINDDSIRVEPPV